MRYLVIGSGAREHALAWALSRQGEVLTSPGNGGTPNNVSIEDVPEWAKANRIDLVVVGPEAPLADGLADRLQAAGVKVFGPVQAAAQLEASKIHAKDFMVRHGVPTARFRVIESLREAEQWQGPVVVKADGLAAGKGVTVHDTASEAMPRVRELLDGALGDAGRRIVLEERMTGHEESLLLLVSGDRWQPLPVACDYKRQGDGDEGPNTGGMGAWCPAQTDMERLRRDIVEPIVHGLLKDGLDYRGVLYVGLMWTPDGPRVLEFNVRFGDPETQVVIPRLASSLGESLQAVAEGRLDEVKLQWRPEAACGVVVAARNYPQGSSQGEPLPDLSGDAVLVFHAGTRRTSSGIVSAGGRLFTAVALGSDVRAARQQVYDWLGKRDLSAFQYRKDIGQVGVHVQR
ncbi:MAG: phosphoribosylamine--glycine ligase [Candidatus Xenobia bacterium]